MIPTHPDSLVGGPAGYDIPTHPYQVGMLRACAFNVCGLPFVRSPHQNKRGANGYAPGLLKRNNGSNSVRVATRGAILNPDSVQSTCSDSPI